VEKVELIWMNGELVPWDEAKVHVLSHGFHYGTGVFEGIRCYDGERGPAVFRLQEHLERLAKSAELYYLDMTHGVEELREATKDLIRRNGLRSCYIRPLVFRGYESLGVSPLKNPVEVYLLAWKWGKYLGDEALKQGVDVCVSSWNRIAPNTLPAMAKAAANYMNAQLIKMEAITNGYVEGIALDHAGNISEGSGENIFVVRNGKIYTPPLGSSVLPGITRASIIQLAEEAGIPVLEQVLAREILYIADEVFFTGTAAEVTPVRSVDRIPVGKGQPGPVTRQLQQRYLDIVEGRVEDKFGWLTYCKQPVATSK
jgi:branched-chain amino acid aminotransferase